MRDGDIYFNNKSAISLGLKMTSYPEVDTINEEYETIEVEGRNGSLIQNKGYYKDRTVKCNFTYINENIELNFKNIYKWLTEVEEEDSKIIVNNDTKCLKVKKVVVGDLKKEMINLASFDVTFICEPFYMDTSIHNFNMNSNNISINYIGNVPGDYVLHIYNDATANITLTINGNVITIDKGLEEIIIDTKLKMITDKNGYNASDFVNGNWIKLKTGSNTITGSSNVTGLRIQWNNYYLA